MECGSSSASGKRTLYQLCIREPCFPSGQFLCTPNTVSLYSSRGQCGRLEVAPVHATQCNTWVVQVYGHVPDIHMSWRLYLPAFLAGNLTSTSWPSTSASFASAGPPLGVLLTTAALLLLPCSWPSSILVMRDAVLGLDRSKGGEMSAASEQILTECHMHRNIEKMSPS